MSDYKLGTNAVIRLRNGQEFRAVRDKRGDGFWQTWGVGDGRYYDHEVTDVRPLVVLDLAKQAREFVIGVLRQPRHSWTNAIADQIEAQTKPPKPAEPTGRGAVVVDVAGLEWVRIHPGGEAWVNGYQRWAHYDDINAVEVVRP